MTEIWRDIPEYEGKYMVSNLGRIKSLSRMVWSTNNRQYIKPEQIMRPKTTAYGYYYLNLRKNGKSVGYFVHRLVAMAFLPKVPNKDYIDHLDGDKTNNCVDNLEWVTIAENNQRAYDKGLKRRIHAGQFLKGMNRQQQYINRRK